MAKLKQGDKVRFTMTDTLFDDILIGYGVLRHCLYGKLWIVTPNAHPRLSGMDIIRHENSIRLTRQPNGN